MSRKHRTVVPDFSSHKPQAKVPGTNPKAVSAPPPPPAPKVKPPATSSKSGRRGT